MSPLTQLLTRSNLSIDFKQLFCKDLIEISQSNIGI